MKTWLFPCAFDAKRDVLSSRVKAWKDACSEAKRHTDALNGFVTDDKAALTAAQDRWRKPRAKIHSFYEERGVPSSVAKPTADTLQTSFKDPAECQINLKYAAPDCPSDITRETFASPFLIPGGARSGTSWLHVCAKSLYEDNRAAAVDLQGQIRTVMARDSLSCARVTYAYSKEISLKDLDGNEVLTHVKGLNCCQTSMWTDIFEPALDAWPLRTHPQVLTQFAMNSVVILLPPDIMAANSDISSYLSRADKAALRECNVFRVLEGDSVWVPIGYIAIVIGTHPHLGWDKTKRPRPSSIEVKGWHRAAPHFQCGRDAHLRSRVR